MKEPELDRMDMCHAKHFCTVMERRDSWLQFHLIPENSRPGMWNRRVKHTTYFRTMLMRIRNLVY